MSNVLDSGNENGWTAFMEVRELHQYCHEPFSDCRKKLEVKDYLIMLSCMESTLELPS